MPFSAIVLSPVSALPLDSSAYERKLEELCAGSKLEKKVVRITEDFNKSFNR